MKSPANFYYDIISPYVYFFLKLRKPLEALVDLKPVPIFFPGLLRLQNNRGPAEIPEKRIHTYPFQFPRRHPFASAAAQRLLLQEGAGFAMIDKAFDFVWGHGGDPETQWSEFCLALGLPATTAKPSSTEIKQALIVNTEMANQAGIFGVPSVQVHERVFWGSDAIPWIIDFLEHPTMFAEAAYQAAIHAENPLLP
jgi:2-hydroxychromene-2-carboxylate isomerase